MRRLYLLIIIVFTLAACTPSTTQTNGTNGTQSVNNTSVPPVPFEKRWIVAVPDFRVVDSNITIQGRAYTSATQLKELARTLAESFSVNAVRNQQFRVTERTVLDAILTEQNLGTSGLISAETASEIGRISGTELLILGSVSELRLMPSTDDAVSAVVGFFDIKTDSIIVDIRVRLDIRAIAVDSAEVLGAVSGEASLNDIEIFVNKNRTQDLSLTSKGSESLQEAINAAVTQGVIQLTRVLPPKS